jgi:histidine triad (HIT) family protein
MSSECIFCKIAHKQAPAKIVYEDEDTIVFNDIHPAAPIHLLVCPKEHYSTFLKTPPEVLSKLQDTVRKVAKQLEIDESGFRMIINNGRGGGQIIFHLHIHLLAGKRLGGF